MDKNFFLERKENEARAGILTTPHGDLATPFFMPVATQAAVRGLAPDQLIQAGVTCLICNTYHIYLRPGDAIIEKAGGLHRFMSWNYPLATDSGGFQIFSLKSISQIHENGIRFQSHVDGSQHAWTPEKAVEVQIKLGADIMMVLDYCISYPSSYAAVEKAVALTTLWAGRCQNHFHSYYKNQSKKKPLLFGIVQGGIFQDLRERSLHEIESFDFAGYAIGGLSVGEPQEELIRITESCTRQLNAEKPRYLMGVGSPEDILHAIGSGVDMFDCVLPTRNARNGTLFTSEGRLNIHNQQFSGDVDRPIDAGCACPVCQNFSRGYLRHLFITGEILGLQLASLHNLYFYMALLRTAREKILSKQFSQWKKNMLSKL